MNSPKIETGQVWEMRNGEQIEVEAILPENEDFPVKSGNSYWQANGRYWNDAYEHSNDLINLISTP